MLHQLHRKTRERTVFCLKPLRNILFCYRIKQCQFFWSYCEKEYTLRQDAMCSFSLHSVVSYSGKTSKQTFLSGLTQTRKFRTAVVSLLQEVIFNNDAFFPTLNNTKTCKNVVTSTTLQSPLKSDCSSFITSQVGRLTEGSMLSFFPKYGKPSQRYFVYTRGFQPFSAYAGHLTNKNNGNTQFKTNIWVEFVCYFSTLFDHNDIITQVS